MYLAYITIPTNADIFPLIYLLFVTDILA